MHMSYHATERIIGKINKGVSEAYEAGEPINVWVNGRPQLHIMSFDPLAYERYGLLQNRAPKLSGALALRSLLVRQITGGALVYAALDSGDRTYGFEMNSHRPTDVSVLNKIAVKSGHRGIKFHTP
jgi:hypothetical protein